MGGKWWELNPQRNHHGSFFTPAELKRIVS
jgi:hypothetical protein